MLVGHGAGVWHGGSGAGLSPSASGSLAGHSTNGDASGVDGLSGDGDAPGAYAGGDGGGTDGGDLADVADGGQGRTSGPSGPEGASAVDEAARSALEGYRDSGEAVLAYAGYLDLFGNVWCCVVEGPGWVELGIVSLDGETGEAGTRTLRLDADAWARELGGSDDVGE